MKKLLFFLILLIGSRSYAQDRSTFYKLALHLTKGKTYYYLTNSKANVTQTVKGKDNVRSTDLKTRIAFTVTGIRDTVYDMDVKYEVISLKMSAPAGISVHNSFGSDPSDAAAAILATLTKQIFKVTLTQNGNLKTVNGISMALDQIFGQAVNIPLAQKDQLKGLLQQSLGEQAFRSNFEMATPIFPSVVVRKGVLWTSDVQLSGSGTANVHTVYELKDITDEFYHIRSSASVKYPDKDLFKNINGMEVRNNLEGLIAADIVVDKLTGWIKQSTISQTINGTTEIKDNPKVPGGVLMPMTMRNDIIVTDLH